MDQSRGCDACDAGAVKGDPPFGRLDESENRAEQRGLAGGVGADQRVTIPWPNEGRDAAQNQEAAVAGMQVLDLQHLSSRPEIEVEDTLVTADLGRCAVGDDPALMQNDDPMAEAEYDLRLMLDENEG